MLPAFSSLPRPQHGPTGDHHPLRTRAHLSLHATVSGRSHRGDGHRAARAYHRIWTPVVRGPAGEPTRVGALPVDPSLSIDDEQLDALYVQFNELDWAG